MQRLRTIHALIGIASIVLFLLSGQYMHLVHGHLGDMPDAPRLLFRSAHIYLLLSALLNVALGLYFEACLETRAKVVQIIGSAMILATPVLFSASFLTESLGHGLHRPMARWAIYLAFGGMLLHLVAAHVLSPRRGGA